MACICYRERNFHPATMVMINQANEIIDEYQDAGYSLTLRQLYYQFVARDLLANTDREYDRLGRYINYARLCGLVDWNAIEDRTRDHTRTSNTHWDSPEEIITNSARAYQIDTRLDQPYYCEVWVEKDALIGVVEQACRELDVPCLSCRGFASQTALWEGARRFISEEDGIKDSVLFHLGDHDPSGIDMTRDIQDRFRLFGSRVEVVRIALNMDQVEKYQPPPNPVKETDSRTNPYVAKYGRQSWELDALDPQVLTELIQKAVNGITDEDRRDGCIDKQEHERRGLNYVSDNWDEIVGDMDT